MKSLLVSVATDNAGGQGREGYRAWWWSRSVLCGRSGRPDYIAVPVMQHYQRRGEFHMGVKRKEGSFTFCQMLTECVCIIKFVDRRRRQRNYGRK